MGVLDRVKRASGLSTTVSSADPCRETRFDVEHHTCPVCGTYDNRRTT